MPGGTELCVVSAIGIQDPTGQVFANGTWQLIFKPNYSSPGPPVDTGVSGQAGPNFIKLYGGSLDGTGSFSIGSVVRNDSIAPSGTKWTLVVSPNSSSQAFSLDLVVTTATLDVTPLINAVITNILISATIVAHAYKDSEVIPVPGSGGFYFDVTLKVLKLWDIANGVWINATPSITIPTGTGFTHVTAGVIDSAAKVVDVSSADITGVLKPSAFPALTGDLTTAAGALATTLATVATPGTGTKVTINSKGLATAVANASLASSDFANQGTTTTVLHGNAAGNPSFGEVTSSDFPTAVINNGANTFTSSGTIDLSLGGSTAFRLPATTPINPTVVGNLAFDSAGGATGGYKAGFSGSTDIFVFNTQIQTLTNKRITPRIVTLGSATTFTPDSDNGDETVMNMTGVAGTIIIAAPSGTPTDGQKHIIRLKTTNAQTYSFNATYAFSTTVTAPTATTGTKTDYIGIIWNATNTKWDVVAVDQGH